jgi:hypothetical protein
VTSDDDTSIEEFGADGAGGLLPKPGPDGLTGFADFAGYADLGADAGALAPGQWVWAAMDPPERRARMRDLAEWVEWLVETHAMHNTVPQCWYRHPPVIEHLSALYAGWVRTYCVEERGGGRDLGEAEWLATLHHFTPYLQVPACIGGGHQEPPPRRAAEADQEDDLAVFLWTSDFGTRPARHPAPDAAIRLVAGGAD